MSFHRSDRYSWYFVFFFYCYGDHPDLHSFPTRRSSDLLQEAIVDGAFDVNPVRRDARLARVAELGGEKTFDGLVRSEEHTSELQSLAYLVCRLLLEKKKLNVE